jgi:hypothetical protein
MYDVWGSPEDSILILEIHAGSKCFFDVIEGRAWSRWRDSLPKPNLMAPLLPGGLSDPTSAGRNRDGQSGPGEWTQCRSQQKAPKSQERELTGGCMNTAVGCFKST